jgi:hypothetical protein
VPAPGLATPGTSQPLSKFFIDRPIRRAVDPHPEVIVTFGLFKTVPGGFVPAQDKQYLVGFAQLPDGATLDAPRTSSGG